VAKTSSSRLAAWTERPIALQSGPTCCLLGHPWLRTFKRNSTSSAASASSRQDTNLGERGQRGRSAAVGEAVVAAHGESTRRPQPNSEELWSCRDGIEPTVVLQLDTCMTSQCRRDISRSRQIGAGRRQRAVSGSGRSSGRPSWPCFICLGGKVQPEASPGQRLVWGPKSLWLAQRDCNDRHILGQRSISFRYVSGYMVHGTPHIAPNLTWKKHSPKPSSTCQHHVTTHLVLGFPTSTTSSPAVTLYESYLPTSRTTAEHNDCTNTLGPGPMLLSPTMARNSE
jgi:hypothetical protein